MSRQLSMIALLGTATLAAGCGSSHDAAGTGGAGGTGDAAGIGGVDGAVDAGIVSNPPPACVNGENFRCRPSGFPFVRGALAYAQVCNGPCPAMSPAGPWTIALSQPQDGTLCLSGTNQDPAGTGLRLDLTVFGMIGPGQLMVLQRFNADLLGITQMRFTIDRPPSGGVRVAADTLHSDVCNGVDCITFGFEVPNRVTTSGTTTTVALVDFVIDPPQTFDTRAIDAIWFDAPPGDFDFCVHDFQFLDANGVAVTPMP